MALSNEQLQPVEDFRRVFEESFKGDPRFASAARHDRPDGATLAIRWKTAANPAVWFELAVRPMIPQVRVGILTDDRWKSEDLEEKIEESGDTMSEFVEMGFHEAGLEFNNPIVEHYREEQKYFYFATAFELTKLADLSDPAIRTKARQMMDGYFYAFGPFLG